jgi:AraC family transcriptional activator of pobA
MQEYPVYAIEDFEFRSNGFYASSLAKHIKNNTFIGKAHRHNFYLFVFFTAGSGTHEIDFNTYPVKKGAVFFLQPGQMHRWELSGDAEGYIFFHTAAFYNITYAGKTIEDFPFFSLSQSNPVLYLADDGKIREHTMWLLSKLLEEYSSPVRLSLPGSLVSLCDLLYLELAKAYYSPEKLPANTSSYAHRLQQLLRLIDRHYLTARYPGHYADLMNMSVKHLNRICKETVNKSTEDLIAERILLEAKRMLVRPGSSVKEIAASLEFSDASYFSRFFKKRSGQSPFAFIKAKR